MSEKCKYCGEFLTLIDVLGRCSTSETDHTRSIFCVDRELKALRTELATARQQLTEREAERDTLQAKLDRVRDPPMQPLVIEDGVIRFKRNKVVEFLLDHGPYDMNKLAVMGFSDEDRSQFAQLIGYSVSGFGELSYAHSEDVIIADELAALLSDAAEREE